MGRPLIVAGLPALVARVSNWTFAIRTVVIDDLIDGAVLARKLSHPSLLSDRPCLVATECPCRCRYVRLPSHELAAPAIAPSTSAAIGIDGPAPCLWTQMEAAVFA